MDYFPFIQVAMLNKVSMLNCPSMPPWSRLRQAGVQGDMLSVGNLEGFAVWEAMGWSSLFIILRST